MPSIDYFFICSSPYAYLGHRAFHDLAQRFDADIAYRPIDIMGVWKESGSVPLGQRSPVRQRYRRIELQRIAQLRGLPINLAPKFFPVDSSLADRSAAALVAGGFDPSAFLWRVHNGLWVDDANIADRATLAAYLEASGQDGEAILVEAEGGAAEKAVADNTAAAVAVDAIGAPVYVLDGEPFWGQDRLDHLEHALATGRAPFRS